MSNTLKEVVNSILVNRNEIRNALQALNLPVSSDSNLEDCANAIKGITNKSANTSKLNPVLCNFVANEDGFVYGSGVSGLVTSDTVFKIPIGNSSSSGASSNIYNYVQIGFVNRADNTRINIPAIAGKDCGYVMVFSTRGNVSGSSYNNILKYYIYSYSNPSISESMSFGGSTGIASTITSNISGEKVYQVYTTSTTYTVDSSYFYIAVSRDAKALFDIS